MVITRELSEQLYDVLKNVAISAGETDFIKIAQYAGITYCRILNEWEEKKGEHWKAEW